MGARRRIGAVTAVVAACALLAAACGRSANSAGSSTAGNISPTKGLVAATAAGTKTVPSLTWAVYRDVNSLDPIYAFDYPENTADLADVRVAAPAGARRLAAARPRERRQPLPHHHGVHAAARGEVLGRPPGDLRRRGLQPGPQHRPQARRVLLTGVRPGQVDRRDRVGPGDDHPQAARLLAGRRARLDTGHHHREGLRPEAGQELRHPGRVDHVHRRVHVQVLESGRGRDRGPQPALLEPLGPPAGRSDHHQGRPGRLVVHLGHADRVGSRALTPSRSPPSTS